MLQYRAYCIIRKTEKSNISVHVPTTTESKTNKLLKQQLSCHRDCRENGSNLSFRHTISTYTEKHDSCETKRSSCNSSNESGKSDSTQVTTGVESWVNNSGVYGIYSTQTVQAIDRSFYNAPLAFQALHMLRQIRPSVCPSHSRIVSKWRNAEGRGLHHWVAQCHGFLVPRMVAGGRPCPGKIWVQRCRLLCENSRAVHI